MGEKLSFEKFFVLFNFTEEHLMSNYVEKYSLL